MDRETRKEIAATASSPVATLSLLISTLSPLWAVLFFGADSGVLLITIFIETNIGAFFDLLQATILRMRAVPYYRRLDHAIHMYVLLVLIVFLSGGWSCVALGVFYTAAGDFESGRAMWESLKGEFTGGLAVFAFGVLVPRFVSMLAILKRRATLATPAKPGTLDKIILRPFALTFYFMFIGLWLARGTGHAFPVLAVYVVAMAAAQFLLQRRDLGRMAAQASVEQAEGPPAAEMPRTAPSNVQDAYHAAGPPPQSLIVEEDGFRITIASDGSPWATVKHLLLYSPALVFVTVLNLLSWGFLISALGALYDGNQDSLTMVFAACFGCAVAFIFGFTIVRGLLQNFLYSFHMEIRDGQLCLGKISRGGRAGFDRTIDLRNIKSARCDRETSRGSRSSDCLTVKVTESDDYTLSDKPKEALEWLARFIDELSLCKDEGGPASGPPPQPDQ